MKKAITDYGKKLNIPFIGIAPAEPMDELRMRLQKHREMFGITPFEEQKLSKRVNPQETLPDAKSIIVCLFPYGNKEPAPENISRYAAVLDYHQIVMQYLNALCDFIRKREPNAVLMPYTDNGPLADKYLAYRAGLGFYGRNTLILTKEYGSYCFIGYILTNIELEPDQPMEQACKNCNACIEACPGGALSLQNGLNPMRCVSYITQSKAPTEEQLQILSKQNSVYGCDVCQEVCPLNRDVLPTSIAEFSKPLLSRLEKEAIEGMSNKEFKQQYGSFPFSWRGKGTILKNFSK